MAFDLAPFLTGAYPRIPKLWGEEIWLCNQAKYCSKLLVLNPGFCCSIHRHAVKEETFFVMSGAVEVQTGSDPSAMPVEEKLAGDHLHLPPGTWHRFWAKSGAGECPTVILEISTFHSEEDVERFEDSRVMDPAELAGS